MKENIESFRIFIAPIVFSIFGGAAGYAMRKGHIRNFWEFLSDFIISIFTGMMVFFLVADKDISEYLRAFFVSMGAFIGRELLVVIQSQFMKKISKGNKDV